MSRPSLLFVLACLVMLPMVALAIMPPAHAQADSGSPVTSASVNSHGNVTAVYVIEIDSPGTFSFINSVQFGSVNGLGDHYAYVDLSSNANTSSPLSVRYGIQWDQRPEGMSAFLQVIRNGTWVDLNSSALVLRPGGSTMALPHGGYQSAVRVDLVVSNVTTGDYNFDLTVYGYLDASQGAATSTSGNSSATASTSSTESGKQPLGPFLGIQTPDLAMMAGVAGVAAATTAVAMTLRRGGIRRRKPKVVQE
ncbi:MAG: hypothetical protein ABSB56_00930 [Nitrososphaerales archaeon]